MSERPARGRIAAVTGASGFIGRRLVEVLAQDGWTVRALMRRPPPPGFWGAARPETVAGDLADRPALDALTADADVVFHSAGLVKARSLADFMAVNAQGARRVAEAFVAAGGGRFVLISSLAAREPQLSHYAASKRAGEDAVAAVVPASRLSIVRPPAVYGPGDRETLDIFKAASWLPVAPMLGGADARLALVHVDDAVAEIARLALRADSAPMTTLGGDRPAGYGWSEILQAAAGAVGRRTAPLRLPPALVRAAGKLSELSMRLDGKARMLTSGKARELLHPDWAVSPAELGPERRPAAFTLETGFADAVAWYRAQGWLAPQRNTPRPNVTPA